MLDACRHDGNTVILESTDTLRSDNQVLTLHQFLTVFLLSCCFAICDMAKPLGATNENGPAITGPKPGEVYKEYKAVTGAWPKWAVIDPSLGHKTKEQYLSKTNKPSFIELGNLDQAMRAEVLVDRWGGHVCTSDKMIRFNGHKWLLLPELTTTPKDNHPECYMSQDNPIIEIPLSHLKEGTNSFSGKSGGQVSHNWGWGQWGLYGIVLRVYYPSSFVTSPGEIVIPAAGDVVLDNPEIVFEAPDNSKIEKVDFLARYDGYDENGDGYFQDWHHFYHRIYHSEDELLADIPITGHLGSATSPPFRITWNTQWVPDQVKGGISIVARVKEKNGFSYVTQLVENLSLQRIGRSVKLYKPRSVPEDYQVRAKRIRSSEIYIPQNDNLETATKALVHFRTWNGDDSNHEVDGVEWFKFNRWQGKIAGANHDYAYSIREIPVETIQLGENKVSVYSEAGTLFDEESGERLNTHSIEVLWPGPALSVSYEHETVGVTELSDRASGTVCGP
ncbi:hypothetical protein [Bythopirellula goksoeyrii]|uniref:Uncharacterized protein n=1 Tax=Bythopirellula goksoeyrii TaxID=1400387 RepID=A0A5B9QH53_9BACT|nr:hypothetical protein [Bythopirellula goksoeyrii]QEG36286.1 hypothetical protein Pr1d_35980 [Bythopirellula goksoeyrii]